MSALIEGQQGPWEYAIGLEVHAQVASAAKLFSGAPTAFGADPNTQVSLVDAAMPGMLPVINQACIEQAVLTGLGFGGTIACHSIFDRKNYFYPDLPQGYQISQYTQPIVSGGAIAIPERTVRITRLHLEQDAGKSIHDRDPDRTLIDLNRAGVALMEIVTEPDLRSPDEAAEFLTRLRALLRWLGTCDGNMQEGSLRCDANVSVRRPGAVLGTRTEIKNLNSIRFLREAIDVEGRRQVEIIEAGGGIEQETRLFDPDRGETRAMRTKEDAHDYRYFPDPDLLPLELDGAFIDGIRAVMPELPEARRRRFVKDLGLSDYDAGLLTAERARADYFESAAMGRDTKQTANWVTGELLGRLNKEGLEIEAAPIPAAELGELIDLVADGTLSGRMGREVFEAMWNTRRPAATIVEERGLKQISDTGALESLVDELLTREADKAFEYRAGKTKLLGFFVGQVMKATSGKANPKTVNELLRAKLET
ncbi:MAG: Asp-tRNA(Asn)/Glu-tRNA(Gln) amidotransferase subunit GatB [Alphaproteobacteria bacterium]|nr:Asp-tRNA(Asn)/Glu-tRNA(Gln) amidotransferase subunit GatB [Alphaproteobacteria bacterium]MCY4229309.1 Asp-tRNA(Asn)/Glu-tRNA(Gln) amidotransferase subunit GatB [Alphaproteobacteria bacterium]MCY4318590.1 Asp-tRNA(Asn)/Glu-tRNA(Gln) amidotransferase subunit GatB [Alphaproteobacteria bacterium]